MKKFLSIFLALIMSISMFSVMSFAQKEKADEVADTFVAADVKEDNSKVVSSEDAFVSMYLGNEFKDLEFALFDDGKQMSICKVDETGIIKFKLNVNEGPYSIVLAGVEAKEKKIEKEDLGIDSVVLQFFFGEDFANKGFVFKQGNVDENIELKADNEGCVVIIAGDSMKYHLTYKDLIDADSKNDMSIEDVEKLEAVTSAEVSEQPIEKTKNKDTVYTVAFFVLLALGIGYLVYDKVAKNRADDENDDDESDTSDDDDVVDDE